MTISNSTKKIDLDEAIQHASQVYAALKTKEALYLGRGFTLIIDQIKKAKFQDLMIDLGVLIFQSQKTPEEGKIRALGGMVRLIACKEAPDSVQSIDLALKVIPKVISYVWMLGQPGSVEKIQHVVMKLFLVKEFLFFNKYYASLDRKSIECNTARKKFWTLISTDRKSGMARWRPLQASGLAEACDRSREAFVLFVKCGNYLKQAAQSKNPIHSRQIKCLKNYLKNTPDEAKVATIFLMQMKASRIIWRHNQLRFKCWVPFVIQIIKQFYEDKLIRKVIPEFINETNALYFFLSGYDLTIPTNELKRLELITLLEEGYEQFSNSQEEREFIYRVFYEIFKEEENALTTKKKQTAFKQSYVEGFQHSIAWRNKQKMPTPKEFAAMKPESFAGWIRYDDETCVDQPSQATVVPAQGKKKKKPLDEDPVSEIQDRKEGAPAQHKTPLGVAPVLAAAVMPDKPKTPEMGPAAAVAVVSKIPSFRDIVAQSKCPIDKYDPRVNRWFKDPEAALVKADPKKEKDPDHLVRVHTLPLILDKLIGTRYCIADKCENAAGKESDLFCLIGEMVNLKINKVDTGVLSIAVDENRMCWHRAWAWETTNEIVNGIISGAFKKISNPTPAEANAREKGQVTTQMDDVRVTIDEAGIMTIPIDETYALRLFPCDI